MFKIAYLNVGYQNHAMSPTKYEFYDSTYVYGANNVGKTAMVQAIDYVLGKSDFNIKNKEGLDNIDYIEVKIIDGSDSLFLKRTSDNVCSYKKDEIDNYIDTSESLYKEELTYFINKGNSKYLQAFYDYAGEELTCRAFTFLNFIDEKGLGNLTNIFTRAKDYQHQSRVRRLMMFIFNFDNVKKLSELRNKEKQLVEYLNKYSQEKANYNYFVGLIQKEMMNLQIDTTLTIDNMQTVFQNYKRNFTRDSKKIQKSSGDVGYLIKVSHALSEELKYQRSLEKQANKLSSRNERANNLLYAFKEIAQDDIEYGKYVAEINLLIEKQINNINILSIKDFSKTIEAIEKRKKKIDAEIENCLSGLDKNDYEDTIKKIGILEQAFNEIKKFKDVEVLEQKELELKETREQIKKLNNVFSETLRIKFNDLILKYYKELDGKVPFATEDFAKSKFKMDFNPLKGSLSGLKAKTEFNDELFSYNPGSMARETTWQVLSYLVMLELLIDEFNELPFMRILFIDGLNQPFDELKDSYPNIYKFVQQKAKSIGIQLVVVSTFEGLSIGAENQIDLTNGFNKAHQN